MIEQPPRIESKKLEIPERVYLQAFPTNLARIAKDIQSELSQRGCEDLGDMVAKVHDGELPVEDLDFFQKNLHAYTEEREHRDEWARDLLRYRDWEVQDRLKALVFGGWRKEALELLQVIRGRLDSEKASGSGRGNAAQKKKFEKELAEGYRMCAAYEGLLSGTPFTHMAELEDFSPLELLGLGQVHPDAKKRTECLGFAWAKIFRTVISALNSLGIPIPSKEDEIVTNLKKELTRFAKSIRGGKDLEGLHHRKELFQSCIPLIGFAPWNQKQEFFKALVLLDSESFWDAYVQGKMSLPWDISPRERQAYFDEPQKIVDHWSEYCLGGSPPARAVEKMLLTLNGIPSLQGRYMAQAEIIGLSGQRESWPAFQTKYEEEQSVHSFELSRNVEVDYRSRLQEFTWRDLARRARPIEPQS